MKFLNLVCLISLPAVGLAQVSPTAPPPAQEDSTAARVIAANTLARDSGSSSRATATMAMATRAVAPPVLDGKTDDEAWRDAQVIDQFLEYEPKAGAEPRFKTEVRVTYDEKYLYVLGRMYDPAPDSMVALLSRRDVRTQSEQLKLMIDSYHDRRTGYTLAVNPVGVKRDYYISDDNNEDPTWDGVWDVATRIDSVGWVAEFRIPFSQLRFNSRPDMTFGFMVVRDIARTTQRISWPLYHRDKQGYISQAGELKGLNGLSSPRRLEVTPYVVTKNEPRPDGTSYEHPQEFSAGADIKYGLSSNLTLDATINPDFGQVEADPAVLNLSAFEQFFEERRPFFLEGAGIFRFRTACGDIDTGCTGLFYSRRIGRSPQLASTYFDANSSTNTTILGAAKIGGRLGRGLSVGLLDAITQREIGAADATIEPRTNYAVARLQQSIGGGDGDIGAMVTAVNRDLDTYTSPYLRSGAYTGGIDLRRRFLNRNYELTAYVAGSLVRGSAAAIEATQRDGVHRYQRPDDGIELDPTRTSLTGNAQRLTVSKFGGGVTRFQSVYQRFSPGFESNDVGFQARADEQMFRNWFALQFNNPTRFYNRASFNSNTLQTWSTQGLATNMNVNTNWHIQFPNTWWGHIGGTLSNFAGSTFENRDARGGPAIRRDKSYDVWTGIELDTRKAYTPFLFVGQFGGDEGRSRGRWVEPTVQYRVSSRFSGSIGAYYETNVNDNQWHSNVGVSGVDTTHYTFARLDQTTLSLTSRFNFTFTPTVSLQFYAQPFISTGAYSNWRELADPRAEEYEDRYQPYAGDPGGFDVKELRSNTVLRWEYRPGSTLFFVWTQGRDQFLGQARAFDMGSDLRDLFRLHPNNTLLIKASYWFNP